MISEIITSHLNVPMKKEDIKSEMGDSRKVKRRICSNRHFLTWTIKNFIYGSLIFSRMILAIPRRQKESEAAILVYSLIAEQVRTERSNLRGFLSDSRLGLEEIHAKDIVVEITEGDPPISCGDPKLRYVKNIPEFYFCENFDSKTRIKIVFRIYWQIARSVVTFKLLDLVFMRQAIIESEVNLQIVKQSKSLDLITTQSSLKRLPSIFYVDAPKITRKVMIWYSNNSNVIEHSSDPGQFDSTRNYRGRIDIHFVWGEFWRNELLAQNPEAVVKAVGSLMFYPRTLEKERCSNSIAIFDVTPITNFEQYRFYSREMILRFFDDLLLCIENVNSRVDSKNQLSLVIKQKRKYTRYSDRVFLKEFKSITEKESVSLSPPESNLYDLISSARMVIGIPYVSPVFIGGECGVPSCYYVSEEFSVWKLQTELDGIPTIVGKNALLKWILEQLSL
jgi:polysaccharide biosynthesis PFTS motif protein